MGNGQNEKRRLQPREVLIRALGVSLVAIAAIAATLAVARQRSQEGAPAPEPETGRAPHATRLDLDALRSAGL